MKTSDRKALINYKRSVAVPILCTDNLKWPIGAGRAISKGMSELATEVYEDVNEILENDIDLSDVAASFVNPTRIIRMSHHLIRALKFTNISKPEIRKTMFFFFNVLSKMKSGSIFNDDGYNKILSSHVLSETIKEADFQIPSIHESKELHKLTGLLWTYSESLFFVAHEVCLEIHGLYHHANKSFLIRDYVNLVPEGLWPNLSLPYNRIRIITQYKSSLNLEFDAYDNPISIQGSFVSDLLSVSVEVDGNPTKLNRVPEMIGKIESAALPIIERVNNWNERDQAKKYVEIFWYRKKPLRDLLQKNWRPPKSIFERIDVEGIPREKTFPVPPELTYSLLDLL